MCLMYVKGKFSKKLAGSEVISLLVINVSHRRKIKYKMFQTQANGFYPFKLLMPALMTSSTSSKLLAITVQELMICFLTM
jgi:hypothetical protein